MICWIGSTRLWFGQTQRNGEQPTTRIAENEYSVAVRCTGEDWGGWSMSMFPPSLPIRQTDVSVKRRISVIHCFCRWWASICRGRSLSLFLYLSAVSSVMQAPKPNKPICWVHTVHVRMSMMLLCSIVCENSTRPPDPSIHYYLSIPYWPLATTEYLTDWLSHSEGGNRWRPPKEMKWNEARHANWIFWWNERRVSIYRLAVCEANQRTAREFFSLISFAGAYDWLQQFKLAFE